MVNAGWQESFVDTGDAEIAFHRDILLFVELNCPERASFDALAAAVADVRIDKHRSTWVLLNRVDRACWDAWRLLAMRTDNGDIVCLKSSPYSSRSLLTDFDEADPCWQVMFLLARHLARVATVAEIFVHHQETVRDHMNHSVFKDCMHS